MPCGPWMGSWDRRGRGGKTDLIILSLLDDCDLCAMLVKTLHVGCVVAGPTGPHVPSATLIIVT